MTNPYFLEDALGLRATQAGNDDKTLTSENRSESCSSVVNSQRLPTQRVVLHMLSGSGTISYRSPPAIISSKEGWVTPSIWRAVVEVAVVDFEEVLVRREAAAVAVSPGLLE